MRRALSGLVTAAVLAGCSSGSEPAPKPVAGAAKGVAEAIARLETGIRSGRYRLICDELFTRRARARAGGADCVALLRSGLQDVSRPRITLLSIRVSGARATARVRSRSAGQRPVEETIELVRQRGRHRIEALTQ